MRAFEGWYVHREWGQPLRNMYWQLRMLRAHDEAGRVKWYRRIRKERIRLHSLGFDQEYTRLYCRFLANTKNEAAMRRLWAFEGMLDAISGIKSGSAHYFKRFPTLVREEHFRRVVLTQ